MRVWVSTVNPSMIRIKHSTTQRSTSRYWVHSYSSESFRLVSRAGGTSFSTREQNTFVVWMPLGRPASNCLKTTVSSFLAAMCCRPVRLKSSKVTPSVWSSSAWFGRLTEKMFYTFSTGATKVDIFFFPTTSSEKKCKTPSSATGTPNSKMGRWSSSGTFPTIQRGCTPCRSGKHPS